MQTDIWIRKGERMGHKGEGLGDSLNLERCLTSEWGMELKLSSPGKIVKPPENV